MLSCGWLFRDVVCYFAIRYSAFEHIGLRETPAFHPSELVDRKAGGSHANRPLCAVRSYGRNPMPSSSVMVSPLIYLKSGDASCTQARPISFSTSPKCPIGGIFTFALNASGYACWNFSSCAVQASGHTICTLMPSCPPFRCGNARQAADPLLGRRVCTLVVIAEQTGAGCKVDHESPRFLEIRITSFHVIKRCIKPEYTARSNCSVVCSASVTPDADACALLISTSIRPNASTPAVPHFRRLFHCPRPR